MSLSSGNMGVLHAIFTFRPEEETTDAQANNKVICTEILDSDMDPALCQVVANHYIHRPCGESNPDAPCMHDERCSKVTLSDLVKKLCMMATTTPYTGGGETKEA